MVELFFGKEVVIVSLGFRWENLLITHSAFFAFYLEEFAANLF